ncbi:hypothetical protein [Xanthomonas campestris]|uniref:hypothetical protein n=1 Tax=Xanthomonas campestris TaxID=339 RepID=UPI0011AF2232|nr:hypothetical protein [Xanthomonas campestris]MEA0761503.1 hypothetical protein [Xanthomonas campestris pv. campestris]MEB1223697.1 hypothetical protein [Xanthomonas campestris pv. campestris]MEB1245185.1 hypothetical protein [Xanthomonas campestris pv. campestris]MEB1252791.1 hypothetical protein [Xanthomonas campestris pv. campestris]MEB1261447.1 hypothetical protein [Xanthomonas campestris pv. campestris]
MLLDNGSQGCLESANPLEVLIDGEASRTINALLGRDRRRSDGIFFSGPQWASRLRAAIPHGPFRRYVDPSCGVGDLLLEVAAHLPLAPDLRATLAQWSRLFYGMDLHAPLAHVAWSRMQALALRRHGIMGGYAGSIVAIDGNFSPLNSLMQTWALRPGDCVLMNPPFNAVLSPSWSKTCRGRVTAAALFLERAVSEAAPGTTIAALVPEVIRSGSRFERLRELFHRSCHVHEFTAQGRFSPEADIDVSILSMTIRAETRGKIESPLHGPGQQTLGDVAKIRVGTIVPHRACKGRASRPYLDVDNSPVWEEIYPSKKARFIGNSFTPPFVVIRRTSGPSDRERARATLVRGKEPVIVENHLLVVMPNKATLKSCRDIIRVLKDSRTTTWLNEMLRCRHLTVRVMKQLPNWTEN